MRRLEFAYRGWRGTPFRKAWIGTTMMLCIGPLAVFVSGARRAGSWRAER